MNWMEALEAIDQAQEMIDDLEDNYYDKWMRGEDFFEDVRAKLGEVRDTVEERMTVTLNQERAIENWSAAIRRWHPDW